MRLRLREWLSSRRRRFDRRDRFDRLRWGSPSSYWVLRRSRERLRLGVTPRERLRLLGGSGLCRSPSLGILPNLELQTKTITLVFDIIILYEKKRCKELKVIR
ncbi:hypothetical protein JYU34_004969 [Plutella xylostella]|uniref:Uncharacterized protein n=1 Tax=Plutella xylostella TaxID=51655 RepID=A0ABQ7QVL5_PLUXY|nr:hypothetical protein JYU34_004969 [Plutella xylostella]